MADFTFTKGYKFGPRFVTLTENNGSPSNLAGVTLTLLVRTFDGETNLISKTLDIVDPPSLGKATINVDKDGPNSVDSLTPDTVYLYKIVDASDAIVDEGRIFCASEW